VLEEDGYGKVVGRLKEMIIRGGENIFPKEIEEFLNTHSDILETYVIGLPHERLGEEVCACIRVKPGSNVTSENIVNFCKGKLSHFKIPSKIHIVDEFPKTTSGKIQKFKLKQIFD
jgi:acyl-CoA synthetase (AMP-forming)/AMP-acid ligase II